MNSFKRRAALLFASVIAAVGLSLAPTAAHANDTGWPIVVTQLDTSVVSDADLDAADTGWPVRLGKGGVKSTADTGWPV